MEQRIGICGQDAGFSAVANPYVAARILTVLEQVSGMKFRAHIMGTRHTFSQPVKPHLDLWTLSLQENHGGNPSMPFVRGLVARLAR